MTDPAATIGAFTERELIARIERRIPPPPAWLPVGIGDDAAVVEPERNRVQVLSVDALVEGVHFTRALTPPDAIGHRALAVNLSDLAAMGALPRLCLLSLALPPAWPVAEFDAMIAGLTSLAAHHRVHVAGGNLAKSPGPLVIDVTVSGGVKRRDVLTRAGARAGDELYVTGSLGAAAAGLQMLEHADREASLRACAANQCVRRYLRPEPRVRIGMLLARNRAATACIDLSDGLADGVRQIASASGIGAIVEADALPVDRAAREWFVRHAADPTTAAVTGGDDYELLFAVRPGSRSRLSALTKGSERSDVPLTRIGVCTADRTVVLRLGGGGGAADRPMPAGYSHFR